MFMMVPVREAIIRIADTDNAVSDLESLTAWFGHEEWFFRGLENVNYTLSSKIEREHDWKKWEERFLEYKKAYSAEELPVLIWLSQQGFPTRVVSFTTDVYKALRYALDKDYRNQYKFTDNELAIWAIKASPVLNQITRHTSDNVKSVNTTCREAGMALAKHIGYADIVLPGVIPISETGIINETEWFLLPCKGVGFEYNLETVLRYDAKKFRNDYLDIMSVQQFLDPQSRRVTDYVVLKIIIPASAKFACADYCKTMALAEAKKQFSAK